MHYRVPIDELADYHHVVRVSLFEDCIFFAKSAILGTFKYSLLNGVKVVQGEEKIIFSGFEGRTPGYPRPLTHNKDVLIIRAKNEEGKYDEMMVHCFMTGFI